jgi:hypothetical protein
VDVDISTQQTPAGPTVHVRVRLSGRETNRLFLSGDTLIRLPLEGALPDADGSPVPRVNLFLSELAGKPDGISRTFSDAPSAEAFAAAVRTQLETALEAP